MGGHVISEGDASRMGQRSVWPGEANGVARGLVCESNGLANDLEDRARRMGQRSVRPDEVNGVARGLVGESNGSANDLQGDARRMGQHSVRPREWDNVCLLGMTFREYRMTSWCHSTPMG